MSVLQEDAPTAAYWAEAAALATGGGGVDYSVVLRNHEVRADLDGYPLRRAARGWVAHPMDGRYVLDALLAARAAAPHRTDFAHAARHLVDAIRHRLEPFRGGRVFWYEPGTLDVGWLKSRLHYSALTQATYARSLLRFGTTENVPAASSLARECFDALLVPEPDGVLQETSGGIYLAEVPMRPRDFVLNAWLTTLQAVHDYGQIAGDARAHDLVDRSVRLLRRLLPAYDIPALANSRYSLTGSVRARIEFDPRKSRPLVTDLAVTVAGEGRFAIQLGAGNRWAQEVDPRYVSPADGGVRPNHGVLQLNLVLSRVGWPQRPTVSFITRGDSIEAVHLKLLVGRYAPTQSVPESLEWRHVATVRPSTAGMVNIPLDWEHLDLIGYPTNFGKRIGDTRVNSFHPIHVARLRSLAASRNDLELRRWADHWDTAMRAWPNMASYRGLNVLIDGDVIPVASLRRASRTPRR